MEHWVEVQKSNMDDATETLVPCRRQLRPFVGNNNLSALGVFEGHTHEHSRNKNITQAHIAR